MYMSWSSIVGIVTVLWVGQCGVQILEVTNFSLLQNVQTVSEAHPASYSVGTGVLSCGWSSWDLKLTTHLHLVLRFKNQWWSAVTPLICLHVVDREKFTFTGLGIASSLTHHHDHWLAAVILLKSVVYLVVILLMHKLHVIVMTGIITENSCRRRLMWKSEGLDDDSCNRTVSVFFINRFLVILLINVYWRCICSVLCWLFGVMWPPQYTIQD